MGFTELISNCLIVLFSRFSPVGDIKHYHICGATVLEVEVDILTGEHKVPTF